MTPAYLVISSRLHYRQDDDEANICDRQDQRRRERLESRFMARHSETICFELSCLEASGSMA